MIRPLPRPDPAAVLAALARDAEVVALRDGARTVIAAAPTEVLAVTGAAGFASLDGLREGWWAGFLSYEAGRAVERTQRRSRPPSGVPEVVLGRFGARLVIDASAAWIEGEGAARSVLERAARAACDAPEGPALHGATSSLDRASWEAAVRRILEHIGAGECYQVNLTRQLVWDRPADDVALFAALARHNPAPHAAFVRLGGVSVVSASPERFLRLEDGRVQTRPIKGTGTDPAAVASSAKDRAENVMIVDLARNDLGRVCVPGSIRVPQLCGVERHPGLVHLVSTVTGRLDERRGIGELLRATFPAASITGAPKPRVMQFIEDLEPVDRGVYCGAVGWIDASRRALDLSVAIRTFTVSAGRTTLGVGGGIVADSDPAAEWRETELKAARLMRAAGAGALAVAAS